MASTPTHKNLSSLVEQPDSGAVEISGGKITRTRIYVATKAVCEANLVYEGTAGTGAETGYVVSSCTVTPMPGQQAKLTVRWEAAGSGSGATLPPDEVGVSPDNLAPRLEKHERYAVLAGATVTVDAEDFPELEAVENAVRATDATVRQTYYDALSATGKDLVEKIRRGNESYYLAALRYVWATHSWTLPIMVRGGVAESPLGPLAGYFVSDIDWLRESDDLQYSNGIWRLTRSWLGGPNGHWDLDIYS